MEKKANDSSTQQQCVQPCIDALVNRKNIEVLEAKLAVVEENTKTVNRLSVKVSLLLYLMSFIITIVSAGALYMFTGLSSFKDTYSEHRLQLQATISQMHNTDKELVRSEIKELLGNIEPQIKELSKKVTYLETRIESNTPPPPQKK